MTRTILYFVSTFSLVTTVSAATGAPANDKERFYDLCQLWTEPPQNITDDVCDCMYAKLAEPSSKASLVEVVKIGEKFWTSIPRSAPMTPAERTVKDAFNACFQESRDKNRR